MWCELWTRLRRCTVRQISIDGEGKLIHSGLGTGVIAIYCEGSTIAGYSWGTSRQSRIWKIAERPLFVGRFVKTEKETP